ncbi:Prolipoprotein diacylglyceryltransferase [Lachnospiraceae bacterium NE2001]|nr:Prolipoprotein diacylglyceryltransferase [Lachnospiraceae bacterium NE2001]
MNFVIPYLEYTFYGPIVLGSIFIGIIVACVIMNKAGVKRVTVFYTALFTFVCIIMCSFMVSLILSRDVRKIGFVGAGGALGLMFGAVTASLIFRDHTNDALTAWIIAAPLMYGLSKIGCHIAGCCRGIPYDGPFSVTYLEKLSDASDGFSGTGCFPIQLTETIAFVLIFVIGLILYLRIDRNRSASIVIILSTVAKIGLEFLRESHVGTAISNYQILIFVIAAIAYVVNHFASRFASNNDCINND